MAEVEASAPVVAGVLGEIVAATAARVAARKKATSLEALLEQAEPSDRSFAAALRRPGARFVLEMKRRSPSRGDLRPGATVGEVAAAYRGLADAVSVLTEPEFFGGSLEDLTAMRAAVEVPVLRKDFILDPWQVAEARLHGADAVLLMLSVLDDETARACLQMCRKLSVEALVEVHTAEELQRALDLDAQIDGTQIIGINNRDLSTLEVDLTTTEELAPRVPADRLLVTESGIGSRHDVARLAPLVDAFLIGSSLMAEPDLRGAAADLTLGRFKVCGLTQLEDAIAARDAGAWRLGTVFAEDSPRPCDPRLAHQIAEVTGLEVVAVFRNQSIEEVIERAGAGGARTLQPHQHLSSNDLEQLKLGLPGVDVWQVHSVNADSRPENLPAPIGDRLFVDTRVDGTSGGTGRGFDLALVSTDPLWREVIVAGGITPERAPAILATAPYAVDLSSSLESEPGIKKHSALQELRRALRPPDRSTVGENRA